MATIRAYSDLEQSRKLVEILPLESADMHYHYDNEFDELEYIPTITEEDDHFILFPNDVSCWSLSALLNILAKIANKIDDDGSAALSSFMGQWSVNMLDCPVEATDNYDNPIDACYNMIIKLNELKML